MDQRLGSAVRAATHFAVPLNESQTTPPILAHDQTVPRIPFELRNRDFLPTLLKLESDH
jgi:hypothetical protein